MGLFKKAEAQQVSVKGHQLHCPVCSETLFYQREAQLNTAVASFFNFDWANRSAICFVCANCTHISWFLGE
ncbi:hypothetical protein [Marinifilum caeruleilacunae]|uniref:DNA-binding protein n=1 Tax=Marinifilum caeruleilacunae TaxID=2499076 RepID=A0ABX1WXT0_9BACT|nr:hypothetical protein [Marinifilum caeruleilacunae]NOU60945.1 hypothetical protein [Marinifilum caeruleilacunae]